MAPQTAFDLQTNHAGTLWIGLRFSSPGQPQLVVYVNGKWGDRAARWNRAADFASCLGAQDVWQAITPIVADLEPLGFALTLSPGRPMTGRIYTSCYGKAVAFFEQMVQALNQPESEESMSLFAAIMMGEERQYPVRSAVCSFGLSGQSKADVKVEFCAHCLFAGDSDATERCNRWLRATSTEPSRYQQLLGMIGPDGFGPSCGLLHSFVGLGWKDQKLYTSIYLKPHVLCRNRIAL
jgi:hypothetical protein